MMNPVQQDIMQQVMGQGENDMPVQPRRGPTGPVREPKRAGIHPSKKKAVSTKGDSPTTPVAKHKQKAKRAMPGMAEASKHQPMKRGSTFMHGPSGLTMRIA